MQCCAECELIFSYTLFSDCRSPPLEEGNCLCKACAESALYERIDQVEAELEELKSELVEVERFDRKDA